MCSKDEEVEGKDEGATTTEDLKEEETLATREPDGAEAARPGTNLPTVE